MLSTKWAFFICSFWKLTTASLKYLLTADKHLNYITNNFYSLFQIVHSDGFSISKIHKDQCTGCTLHSTCGCASIGARCWYPGSRLASRSWRRQPDCPWCTARAEVTPAGLWIPAAHSYILQIRILFNLQDLTSASDPDSDPDPDSESGSGSRREKLPTKAEKI